MHKKSNTSLFHPVLINLTTHLLHNIIGNRNSSQNFNCLTLQSIDYEHKENQIEVVLQFNIISGLSASINNSLINNNNNNDTYKECDYAHLLTDNLAKQTTESERKSPFVTIVVCCCILTTFLLMVLFLRCRGFIRRKRSLKTRRNPKYLYCSSYSKAKPINHCYIKANNSGYWSPVRPKHSNSFSVCSEGQSLNYNHHNHRITSASLSNQCNPIFNSSQSRFYGTKDSNSMHRQCNSSNNIIIHNHHQGELYETKDYMTTDCLKYSKRINNAKSTHHKPFTMTSMYPDFPKLIMPPKRSNPSNKVNSHNITNENEVTDSETPTTEFTESSKSHRSTSQINVCRKGRSLSPVDLDDSRDSKFVYNKKPRFSLAESNELCDKAIENNPSSGFHDVIVDCSSLESAISYPVQNAYSHLSDNKNLDGSLECQIYQSLMSVYLNDVQKNKTTNHTVVTSTITTTTATVNISNIINGSNTSSNNYSTCLDNNHHNNVNTLSPLNIPKIATIICGDEIYDNKKMNSSESNQPTIPMSTDNICIEQYINFNSDLPLPVIKNKRSVQCLFSANKYNHKRYIQRSNSISIDDIYDDDDDDHVVDDDDVDENRIGNNGIIIDTKQDIDERRLRHGINITARKSSINRRINRTIRSSNNINIDENTCNHNLKFLLCHTSECKSCVNLQAYKLLHDRCRNSSGGSTVSQIPRSDLPDVYLNPPSMSTLQSQRSSLCGRSRMELLYVDNELDRTENSGCNHSTDELNGAKNLSNILDCNHYFTVQSKNEGRGSWNLADELVIFPQPQTLGLVRNQTFSAKSAYHQNLPQSSSNLTPLFFKPYQLIDDNFGNLPVKDKEHNISIQQQLRRALSLSTKRKSPRSLNAEIQSIMDKHYEMTGIKMTIGSGSSQKNSLTTKSYMNLFRLQGGNKMQSPKPRKRRCSWTFTKDITHEFQTGLKNVSSALHLDCSTFDLFQKFKHNREKPSVFESLSMTALPCLIPLRPRIRSDVTNDMTVINEEFIGRSDLNNIKLIDFKRNSLGTDDKNITIFEIQKNIRLVKSNWNLTNV
ncbi:unnamed protein product [Schistosoma turkestanicum]|nr:unnamed protein product [Schistosoma turkestanicum]